MLPLTRAVGEIRKCCKLQKKDQRQHVFVISVLALRFALNRLMVKMEVEYYAGTGQ